jgi:uncharacterized membrane-anchored protein
VIDVHSLHMVDSGVRSAGARYVPAIYWMAVVLISIVGTLITDNLSDNYDVPLEVTTAVFAGTLAVAFGVWYRAERTLSIHTIITRRRESFYWLAILFTFALGTAAGTSWPRSLALVTASRSSCSPA